MVVQKGARIGAGAASPSVIAGGKSGFECFIADMGARN
jgi:hypothetical protein